MGKMQDARDALATYLAIYADPTLSAERADAAREQAALAINKIAYAPSTRGKVLKEFSHDVDAIYNLALEPELDGKWQTALSEFVAKATGNEKYTIRGKVSQPDTRHVMEDLRFGGRGASLPEEKRDSDQEEERPPTSHRSYKEAVAQHIAGTADVSMDMELMQEAFRLGLAQLHQAREASPERRTRRRAAPEREDPLAARYPSEEEDERMTTALDSSPSDQTPPPSDDDSEGSEEE